MLGQIQTASSEIATRVAQHGDSAYRNIIRTVTPAKEAGAIGTAPATPPAA